LPSPLRKDADYLPVFALDSIHDNASFTSASKAFNEACKEHSLLEERRTAYVALTRARHKLLLTGAWWKGTNKKHSERSCFLDELVQRGKATRGDWVEKTAFVDNPQHEQGQSMVWPREDALSERSQIVGQAALAVASAMAQTHDLATIDDDLARRAELLLAERDHHDDGLSVRLPQSLAATGLVALAADPERYAVDLRRPMPRAPLRSGRRGTAFHAWVEEYFTESATLDDEDFFEPSDSPFDVDGDETFALKSKDRSVDIEDLKHAFLSSPWAGPHPEWKSVRTELDIEAMLGDMPLRCRIDAIFEHNDGSVEIVDWKTGQAPKSPEEKQNKAIQLALYRAAYAAWAGVRESEIRCVLYYVASGVSVDLDNMESSFDVRDLIREALASLR
jgi:DNA helicase-2/ATP-dependent DNA helicase PcrA